MVAPTIGMIVGFLSGCPPFDPPPSAMMGATAGSAAARSGSASQSQGVAGAGGDYATADIRKELELMATMMPLRPLPSDATLCQLRYTNVDKEKLGTSIEEVKKLFGDTDSESQSISDASLVYRFACPQPTKSVVLCGVSLSFTWRSESFWNGPPSYYLDMADVRGVARPACWPHVDPTGN
jgi:hypothetical protein